MKNKIPPINKERKLRPDSFIVSKTDLKGRITYCNEIFMEIAGFQEEELLEQQHNIIRHPDMPRAAFDLLWKAIQQGNEFLAYVKNMAKDGSYYWVFATVSPIADTRGNVTSYFSVRRKPSQQAVDIIAPIYAELLAIEKQAGTRDAIQASTEHLLKLLRSHGQTYEEFVLSLPK